MHRRHTRTSGASWRSTARVAAAVVGATSLLGVAASGASATALNGPAGPLAAGSSFSGSLSGTATFGRPGGSQLLCSTGTFGATVGSPGAPLPLSAPVFDLGTCSQRNFTIRGVSLLTASGVDVETPSTAAGFDGDVRMQLVRFLVTYEPTGSTGASQCPIALVNVRGRLRNSDHSVTFQSAPIAAVGQAPCMLLGPGYVSATFSGLASGGAPVTVSPTP